MIAPSPVVLSPQAEAPFVSAALTETRVNVSTGFRGAEIVLYGAVFDPRGRPSDVVVVVRSPVQTIRLVRKVQRAGLWVNSRPVVFEGAPGFYMAASTRDLADVAGFATLRRLGIGVDHLRIEAPAESRRVTRYGVSDVVVSRLGADYLDWREAVVRLKERMALYSVDPRGVAFVDRGLFRARVRLPADAPFGRYRAEVWLFQDGRPVSVSRHAIIVEKVGLERSIYRFAHERPWSYGVISVLMALLTGAVASRLFRRS